jgi:hypothetical protein
MKAVTTRHTLLIALGIATAAAVLGVLAGTYGLDAHTTMQPPQQSSMSTPF